MAEQRQLPLAAKREPSLDAAPEVGKAQPHRPDQQARLDGLRVDIYRLTGRTVSEDDPIILAALFQSELVRESGRDAAAALLASVATSVTALADAVKEERRHAAALDQAAAMAIQQIAGTAKALGEQELTTIHARFTRMASETLEQVRRDAARRAPRGRWHSAGRYGMAALLALLLGGLGGGWVGMELARGQAARLSPEQLRLLHNGMLLDEAWPRLPAAAREALRATPGKTSPTQRHDARAVGKASR